MQGNKQEYWTQLTGQVEEKRNAGTAGKEEEDQAQAQHFRAWDNFWGRPGYGAPRQEQGNTVAHKENLMKMLHYPQQVRIIPVSSAIIIENNSTFQAPNNLELSTLERLPVK